MRWDMFKVIVERPRVLGWKHKRGRAEQQARQDPELAPLRASCARGRQRNHKHLNENLAPLRRYVMSQIGRPWDKVNAEICEHLRLASAVQLHVLQHLDDFVVKAVDVVDGRPLHRADHRPVVGSRWRAMAWVCPRSGILRRSPGRVVAAAPPAGDRVDLADGDQLQRIGGVWYRVVLAPTTSVRGERTRRFDVVLREPLEGSDSWLLRGRLEAQYGRPDVYAAQKIQLGKRALARLLPEGMR
jgi:hypothetical protein